MSAPVLAFDGLSIAYRRRGRWHEAVSDVDLAIAPGEAYGLVGESGCGKSTLAMAAMGYLPDNARVSAGGIRIAGEDLAALDAEGLRRLRGGTVAAVYQSPGTALNPALTVGEQIAEVYRLHRGFGHRAAWDAAAAMLERVQIPDGHRVRNNYPYQLSGGMQQRVVIAMGLAGDPDLLVLDEPTTALDTTVQAEILALFEGLRAELDVALLFISHNLGVVQAVCDRVGVMYAGELVEEGPAETLFHDPRHPYTAGLIACIPDFDAAGRPLRPIPGAPPEPGERPAGCVFAPRCPVARDDCRGTRPPLAATGPGRASRCLYPDDTPAVDRGAGAATGTHAGGGTGDAVLRAEGLHLTLGGVPILRDVDVTLRRGETLALVGESGSGKTSLARVLTGLARPRAGTVSRSGRGGAAVQPLQMVFQSPDGTLNPSHRIGFILARAIRRLAGLGRRAARERVPGLMRAAALDPALARRRGGQLSGGQRQRVAIARAFAGTPDAVVLDEPTSALDVSVQAAILELLRGLRDRQGVAYLFITHDLAVVRHLADRVAVMYLGVIVEEGPADAVLGGPCHPYTEALIAAVPRGRRRPSRPRLTGTNPGPAARPAGCPFHTRCPHVMDICRTEAPPRREPHAGHGVHCHLEIPALPRPAG
ncbi:ABC transporter ATP-binding protein [Arhodomonas aquaeolei]|uniref:dipeptide ABC transporter ATP-binding protein n=1 Tax=Arhodomonas aquaeolei TaxID=2369 RepID=UPI0003651ADF|nr:ABC transporter ATP-binding protein [Arhodomonas aquaeolei]